MGPVVGKQVGFRNIVTYNMKNRNIVIYYMKNSCSSRQYQLA